MSQLDLKSGFEALEQGNVAEAERLLCGVIGDSREGTQALFGLAVATFRRGQFATAIDLLRLVVHRAPRHHKALYYLGLAHERRGEVRAAVHAFQHALMAQPEFREASAKLRDYATPPHSVVDHAVTNRTHVMRQGGVADPRSAGTDGRAVRLIDWLLDVWDVVISGPIVVTGVCVVLWAAGYSVHDLGDWTAQSEAVFVLVALAFVSFGLTLYAIAKGYASTVWTFWILFILSQLWPIETLL